MGITKEGILEVLKTVIDPEIGINIVDMGFIYKIEVDGKKVRIEMTLTTPGCPMCNMFLFEIEKAVKKKFGNAEVKIDLVFDPPWTPERMKDAARKALGI